MNLIDTLINGGARLIPSRRDVVDAAGAFIDSRIEASGVSVPVESEDRVVDPAADRAPDVARPTGPVSSLPAWVVPAGAALVVVLLVVGLVWKGVSRGK